MVNKNERNHGHDWKLDSIQLLLAKANVRATYICRTCQGVKTRNVHIGYPSKMAMPDEDVMALRRANKAARLDERIKAHMEARQGKHEHLLNRDQDDSNPS